MTKKAPKQQPVISAEETAMVALSTLRETIGNLTQEDTATIASWEKQIKTHALRKTWLAHPITAQLMADLSDKVARINIRLCTEEGMDEQERRAIFKGKEAFMWLATLFTESDEQAALEHLNRTIEEQTETFRGYLQ